MFYEMKVKTAISCAADVHRQKTAKTRPIFSERTPNCSAESLLCAHLHNKAVQREPYIDFLCRTFHPQCGVNVIIDGGAIPRRAGDT